MFVQRPGRGCGQSHRAQVQDDVLSDHVRERSARQRADGLGCQGDDALHRADLPEQPFRGGDLFDGFAQDEVHRHGEAPHELGDAYQCDHHGVAVLDCEGRQRHEQRRQSGREQRGDEQGPDAMRRMRAPAATELTIPPMPLHVAARPTAT